MAILTDNRSSLDAVLGDPRATVMVLIGSPQSLAGSIHDCAEGASAECGEGVEEDWRHTFLITDASLLEGAELQQWFGGDDQQYAILNRTSQTVCNGELIELTKGGNSTAPDILNIELAFARCEA